MELQSETILDLKAFNRLFGEYQQRFIRFAGTYVSDAATAEDIVMESFMAAWELFSEEARRLVNETLDRLPEKTRAIFIRSRFDGKSYKEIAAEMGVTVKSVEFEVSKAMKILRVVLKDYLAYFIFWFYIN